MYPTILVIDRLLGEGACEEILLPQIPRHPGEGRGLLRRSTNGAGAARHCHDSELRSDGTMDPGFRRDDNRNIWRLQPDADFFTASKTGVAGKTTKYGAYISIRSQGLRR